MAAAVHKGQRVMAGGGNMVGRKGPASSWHGVGSVKARRKTRDRAGSQFRQDRVIDQARQEGAQHWYARALLSTDYMRYERQSSSKVTSRLHWRHFIPLFCEQVYCCTLDVNSLGTLESIVHFSHQVYSIFDSKYTVPLKYSARYSRCGPPGLLH